MNRKIKVIIKRPDEERGHVCWISSKLENLQTTVGGFIEVFPLTGNSAIICNEEGKLMGLPANCRCCGKNFVGTIIMVGLDRDDFTDVPEGAVELWKHGLLFYPVRT
ncbi:MAG: DUF3846 domain-containing protein [Acidaminococcaceae bacterium]|nr:DUF3846 domain-containing protein [Acidaminococcaceae bacterium]